MGVKRTIEITPAGIALVRIDRTLTAAGFAGSVVDLDGIARRVEALVQERDAWRRRALTHDGAAPSKCGNPWHLATERTGPCPWCGYLTPSASS